MTGRKDLRPSLDEKWKVFLKIDGVRRDDKLRALDDFLTELVPALPEIGNSLKNHFSGDFNGIASILTRHFLVDVHQICVASGNEDETQLLRYLNNGRGRTILSVLLVVGIREITCNWELANLLLSIMAAFQNLTANSAAESDFVKALRLSLEDGITNGQYIPTLELLNAVSCGDTSVFKVPVAFTDHVDMPQQKELLTGSHLRHSDAHHMLDCVFSLLGQLCHHDVGDNVPPSPSGTVSAMVLTVLLELLKKIAAEIHRKPVAADTYVVQKMVALTVSTAMSLVQRRSTDLQRCGIFAVLLQLTRRSLDQLDVATDSSDANHFRHEAINCLVGCAELMLADSFTTRGTHVEASEAHERLTATFEHFRRSGGIVVVGDALERLLCRPQPEVAESVVDEERARYALLTIAKAVGELTHHLRTTRLMAQHGWLTDRQRCRRRDEVVGCGHHHTLRRATSMDAGAPSTDVVRFVPENCAVAISVTLLLRLLNASELPDADVGLLSALSRCGLCCCLDLDDYFRTLLAFVGRCPKALLQERGLRLLETAVTISATFTVSFDCAVALCEWCRRRLRDSLETLSRAIMHAETQKPDPDIISDPDFAVGFWKVFDGYKIVLPNAEENLLQLMERSLSSILHSTIADEIRLELYVRVFLPLLRWLSDPISAEAQPIPRQHEELTRFCLRTVASLLHLPHAYRLLVASQCIERIFRLVCHWSGSLRHALLELLARIMLLEAELEENRECHLARSQELGAESAPVDPMGGDNRSIDATTRHLYRSIVLNHTLWFKNVLHPESCSEEENSENKNCSDHDHPTADSTPDENIGLLRCLVDLWRTLCYFVDHAVGGSMRWSAGERATMSNVVLALVSHCDWPRDGSADEAVRLRWELFGSLLHVLSTCEEEDGVDGRGLDGLAHLLDTLRTALIARMATESGNDHFSMGCLFQSLLSSSSSTSSLGTSNRESDDYSWEFEDLLSGEEPSVDCNSASERDYDGDTEDEDSLEKSWRVRSTKYEGSKVLVSTLPVIRCPKLLQLLLDLAVAYFSLQSPISAAALVNLTVLHRGLVRLCEASRSNCNVFARELSVVSYVLVSQRIVLLSTQLELSNLQDSLLSLLSTCAAVRILPAELRLFLKMFAVAKSSLGKLHACFGRIIAQLTIVPHVCIHFAVASKIVAPLASDPLEPSSRLIPGHRRQRSTNGASDKANSFAANTVRFCNENFPSSCWAVASLIANFPADRNTFNSSLPSDAGMSVSLWLNVNSSDVYNHKECSISDELHLFSCGTDRLLLEVWLRSSPPAIVFRLSTFSTDGYKMFSERAVDVSPLRNDTWQHLTVSWRTHRQHPHRYHKSLSIKAAVHLDSREAWSGTLECALQRRWHETRRWLLLLGHHSNIDRAPRSSCWSLGPLAVFAGVFFNVQWSALLHAAGPNCVQLELPGGENRSRFDQSDKWNELREFLLASFLPQNSNVITWYPELRRISTTSTILSSTVPITKVHRLVVASNNRLDKAVARAGGAATLFGLLAWTVEKSDDEEVQASCLRNLVDLMRKCPDFERQFRRLRGWDLIFKVLSTTECQLGPRLLSVLLNACTSEPLLRHRLPDWWIDESCAAMVTDRYLLIKLLNNWTILHRPNRPSVLHLFLASLHVLIVSFDSSSRLETERLLESVLALCRERALDGDTLPLSDDASHTVVELLRLLCGRCGVEEYLLDFLAMMQPSRQTYACQVNYYFLSARLPSSAGWPRWHNGSDLGAVVEVAATPEPREQQQLSKEQKLLANEQLKREIESEIGCNQEKTETTEHSAKDLPSPSEVSETSKDANISGTFPYATDQQPEHEDKTPEKSEPVTVVESKVDIEIQLNEKENQDESIRQEPQSPANTDLGIISAGVLDILCNAAGSVTEGENVLSLIDPRLLVVVALHPELNVREATLRLFRLYVSGTSEKMLQGAKNLLHLLANQLHQYDASLSTLETSLAIFCGSDVALDAWQDGSGPFQSKRIFPIAAPLVLAQISRTLHNPTLCHNFLRTLIQLCRVSSDASHELYGQGLVQSLLAMVTRVMHEEVEESNRRMLLDDTFVLLSDAMLTCMHTNVSRLQRKIRDGLKLVTHYELVESHRCGADANCVRAFRDLHCACLYATMSSIADSFGWECHSEYDSALLVHGRPKAAPVTAKNAASVSDLKQRFAELLQAAVDLTCFADVVGDELSVSEYEQTFSRFLLRTLVEGASVLVDRSRTATWHSLAHTAHDLFRSQLGRALTFAVFPTQSAAQRQFALELIARTPKNAGLVGYALKQTPELAQRFCASFHLLIRDASCNLSDDCLDSLIVLQTALKQVLAVVEDEVSATAITDKWLEGSTNERLYWVQKCWLEMERFLSFLEAFAADLSGAAQEATDLAVATQNEQRKVFLSLIKRQLSDRMTVRQRWQAFVSHLTHERAPWYQPDSYPTSWSLDPTEGPFRVRRRLERCQLTMEPRFLMSDRRDKLAAAQLRPPLAYLFEKDRVPGELAAINDRIQNSETIDVTFHCVVVTPSTEAKGELLFGRQHLYFIGEESYRNLEVATDVVSHTWLFADIVEIHRRRHQLRNDALELFLSTGRTHLLALSSVSDREALYERLTACELPNLLPEYDSVEPHTVAWRERRATNFEYLTQLNKSSGRTFNDLMQYPVFPFIVADYKSTVLDLRDPRKFRNLSRPMAIQDASKESRYVSLYQFLEAEQITANPNDCLSPAIGPYHYGSHYSNSGIVLHFLVRLPPFTDMFLDYQDHNFDIPDRTFHSVSTSWRLSSSESTTDVKELIPEFFYLPEFLRNGEGYDLGVRQTGARVSDVALPKWCRRDPRLFVLVHRQALESTPVTDNLHHWIDLVFGVKQTGRAAVDAVNVFHPATYYGFEIDDVEDLLRREAMRTMVKTFGQTPRQLFRSAHPMTARSPTAEHRSSSSPPGSHVPVMEEVRGLCWGRYVGSPDEREPKEVWRRSHSRPIRSLVPMITDEVFGLTEGQCLLVRYCRSHAANMLNTTYVACAALVLYDAADGVVRLRLSRDGAAMAFVVIDPVDPVSCCATAPDCPLLFIGRSSGAVRVHQTAFDDSKQLVKPVDDPVDLFGHTDAITAIAVNLAFGVVVTASRDSTCIVWDLNKLSYVRSITDHRHVVHAVAVSDTSGDVASVSDTHLGSRLALHTINAQLVGAVMTERSVRSLCFSCAPEGVSVNVLCAGMDDGSVVMWSSWDLKPVRTIKIPGPARPILCLAYSPDARHLYVAAADGTVYIFESVTEARNCVPKFRTVI